MNKKSIKIIAAFLGIALFAYLFISYQIIHSLVSGNPRPLGEYTMADDVHAEDISFSPREDSFKLSGWYLSHKEREESLATLIFVHGINTNRLSGPDTLNIATDLVREGFDVVMFDLRAKGKSEGPYSSASYFERLDILGAFDYLRFERGISENKIGILGFSMGAAASILATKDEPLVQALVVDSPFADARKLVTQEAGIAMGLDTIYVKAFIPMVKFLARSLYGINLDQMVPEEAVKDIKFPILIIHGDKDDRVKIENSQAIYKNANPECKLEVFEDCGHTNAYSLDKERYLNLIISYFKDRLTR